MLEEQGLSVLLPPLPAASFGGQSTSEGWAAFTCSLDQRLSGLRGMQPSAQHSKDSPGPGLSYPVEQDLPLCSSQACCILLPLFLLLWCCYYTILQALFYTSPVLSTLFFTDKQKDPRPRSWCLQSSPSLCCSELSFPIAYLCQGSQMEKYQGWIKYKVELPSSLVFILNIAAENVAKLFRW